jgi:hypothetical protein
MTYHNTVAYHVNWMTYQNTVAYRVKWMTYQNTVACCVNWMTYQNTVAYHHLLFGSGDNCSFSRVLFTCCWKARSFCLKSAANFWQSKDLLESENPSVRITVMHTPIHAGLVMVSCDVARYGKLSCFTFYCLTRNQQCRFSLQAHKCNNFLFWLLKMSFLGGHWNIFWWSLH